MNRYQVEIIVEVRNVITVIADDTHEALKLAKLQRGEHGQPSAPVFTYKPPKLLGAWMANNHGKTKGRKDEGRYCALPHNVMDSASFSKLSGNALKVLLLIYRQYNGNNNGDLSAPFSKADSINIGSQTTWYKAIKELVAADLIMVTRESMKKHQGNPNGLCTLFAVTWKKIDECKGKLNCSPTLTPPRKFSLDAKH